MCDLAFDVLQNKSRSKSEECSGVLEIGEKGHIKQHCLKDSGSHNNASVTMFDDESSQIHSLGIQDYKSIHIAAPGAVPCLNVSLYANQHILLSLTLTQLSTCAKRLNLEE